MMLQYNNEHSNNIKDSDKIISDLPFLSYNSGINYPVLSHIYTNENNNSAEGGGYAPIVRQPTHEEDQSSLKSINGGWKRQNRVKENYPLTIPGTEEQCDESKEVLGAYRCNDCHTVEVKTNHCEGWGCRVCGSRKVRRQSKNIVQRLNGFKAAIKTAANPRQVVISSNFWINCDIAKITKDMNNLFARQLRGLSGVYVIHPFRIRGWDSVKAAGSKARFYSDANIKRRLREFRKDQNNEISTAGNIEENLSSGGLWEMVKNDVLELGSWRAYCYVSPHVHIIAWGSLPKADDFHKMTNGKYIYKMIDTNGIGRSFDFTQNSFNFDFSSEILRTLNYLGSHAAIKKDDSLIYVNGQVKRKTANRIFRPFGLCSTKKLKMDTFEDHKIVLDKLMFEIKCPECSGSNLVVTSKDNKSHDPKKPFDDDYNPIDFEGDIIQDLIKPLKYFEWTWYKFKFNHVYYGDIEKFAAKLPKPKPYKLPDNYEKLGKLEKSIILKVSDYDKVAVNNSPMGVVIE